jgi:lysyl-tRNA synthetase class 2
MNDDLDRLKRLKVSLRQRAVVVAALRRFFEQRGSLEVETPLRVRTPGSDLHLDPEPAGDRFLITSPEFHMKRLVGAGFERVHQLCRCFRRGERGHLHNPEFTMLEWYWAGATYLELADELEEMLRALAIELTGSSKLPLRRLDLAGPWERVTVNHAFEKLAGWRPGPDPDPDRFFLDLVEKVEPRLGRGRPTFLIEYPASQAVLSRRKPDDPDVAERFELYLDGIELVNAFQELTDPTEQRARFEHDNLLRQREGKPPMPIDERLLAALGEMPPTSGAALGLDRLIMLMVGATSIDQMMAFTDEWV